MTYKKSEVEFHSEYGREGNLAVNIKVHETLRGVKLPLSLGSSHPVGHPELIEYHKSDPRFTMEWIEKHVPESEMDSYFWSACEWGVERLIEDATGDIFADYNIKLWQEGRSGGWLVVEGLPEIEDWDAIMLGKWHKFKKRARDAADGVPEEVIESVYYDCFEPWAEKEDERTRVQSRNYSGVGL